MRLGTHSAGTGTVAGASRPRTPGRETRCVCGRTALSGDAAGRWGTPAKKARPGGALRLRPHGAGGRHGGTHGGDRGNYWFTRSYQGSTNVSEYSSHNGIA